MVRDVGRYKVVEAFISTSGQGGVHRAVCRLTGTVVALKQIEPGALGEAQVEEMHDAIAARRHPGLSHQVEVFRAPALDRPDGPDVLYVVSVWVDGVTLDRRAAGARLPEIIDWVRQAAEALDFLNAELTPACPLLHRDVKPTNIVVTPDGAAVLIDPGLARRGPSSVTGTPYGTPGFIPPECDADPTAGSSAGDRWQLAATLVAALLGKPPRHIGDDAALRRALVRRVKGDVAHPEVFADALLAMLVPSPDDRPASASRWMASVVAAAAPRYRRSARRRRRTIMLAAVVILVGLVLGAASLRGREPGEEGVTRRVLVDTRQTSGREVVDQRRAYLTTQPRNFCRALGCAVEGGAVSSGMWATLICRVNGQRVTNGNPLSSVDDDNPILFSSEVWYGARLDDGTRGLLSEVWVHPDFRVARGLPFC